MQCKRCGDKKGPFVRNSKGCLLAVCRGCDNKRRRAKYGGRPKEPVPPQPKPRKTIGPAPVYVVTYAQNATPICKPFFASLLTYCRDRGAQLLVVPGRYKNPTSQWSARAEHDDWWAPELAPYLFNGVKQCGKHLRIFGDISVQPTDTRPVNGFEAFCRDGSGVFAHPRLHFKTVASGRRLPRILTTTGAVTVSNYVPAKAGKKAAQLHTFGACIVEQDGDLFHVRQVVCVDPATGEFTDLDQHYTPTGVRPADAALSMVLGDIHVAKSDPEVLHATFGRGGIVDTVKPGVLVLHDVLDWDARNHHERGRVDKAWDRRHGFLPDVSRAEVREACQWIAELPTPWLVVRSNHDDAFDRWLNATDPRSDPRNMWFWCQSWDMKFRARAKGAAWPDAFEAWFRRWSRVGRLQPRAPGRFLPIDKPHSIGGVYVHFHGHKGPDGTRGTLTSYAKLGVPISIGHRHSPGIEDACFQAGVTARLDHDYNNLPSSWLNTHIIQYATTARCLVSIIGGRWAAGRQMKRRKHG